MSDAMGMRHRLARRFPSAVPPISSSFLRESDVKLQHVLQSLNHRNAVALTTRVGSKPWNARPSCQVNRGISAIQQHAN